MSRSKIYIHIGLHKTGTTYQQKFYFPRLDKIEYLQNMNIRLYQRNWKFDSILISSEGLSGSPWNPEWKRGKRNDHNWLDSFENTVKNLKSVFPEAHIIITFRKHGDLIISLYKQYLHEGGVLNLDEFYNEKGVIGIRDLNFRHRINFLREHFKSVDVLSFEKFKKEGDSYLGRYFRNQGFSVGKAKIERKSNSGVSGKKIELLRSANLIYQKTPILIKKFLWKTGFTPRKVFQEKLTFWNTKDSDKIKILKNQINEEHNSDWQFVENEEFENH